MPRINGRAAVILLVEDDPGDQELTRRALEDGKVRNDLYIVEDGEEALDYLLRRGLYQDPESSPRPDLILLDLNMPKMDGKQVLEEMKKHDDLRCLTVIVLTTSAQEEDVLRSYDLGVNSYITKPVEMSQFFKVVHAIEEYWFQIVRLPPKVG